MAKKKEVEEKVEQEVVEKKTTKKKEEKEVESKETPKEEKKEESKVKAKEEKKEEVMVKKKSKAGKYIIIFIILLIIVSALGLGLAYFVSPYTISLNGDKEITINMGDTYEEKGAVVKRFIFVSDKSISVEGEVNTSKGGDYNIVYKYDSMSITRIVHVKDSDGPRIMLLDEDKTLILDANGKKDLFEGIGFYDVNDGIIEEDEVEVEENIDISTVGEYEVKYKVCDKSNNCSELTRRVEVKDISAPIITLERGDLKIPVGNTYNEYGAKAVDNYDKNLGDIKIESNVDTSKEGTYEVKYSICDLYNNCAEKIRKVTVFKQESTTKEETKTVTISGKFQNHPTIDGTIPSTITFNSSNKTVEFVANCCSYMDSIKGTYSISGSTITVTLDHAINTTKTNKYKFSIINANKIKLVSEVQACAPYTGDIFTK